ncbi:MAG: hypothetical protein KIS61_26295, partial [Candidatus Eremiobacteraeota bacterium]|nr:hypothetical protein [Candidatus Eremiobacteraeota bacterium]
STSNELAWFQPLPRRRPEPLDCDLDAVPDQLDLSPQAQQGPIPQTVNLPEDIPFQPYRPRPEFRGKAPLPRKLDVHCLTAGERVAEDARSLKGKSARSLTWKLPGFQNTTEMPATNYGTNNQCANFVSTFARRLGLKGHYLVVPDLERAMKKQGWQRVSAADARPGDVWISDSHTELVTGRANGKPRVTGCNNGGNSYQTVSEHTQTSGRFYTRPIWRDQH